MTLEKIIVISLFLFCVISFLWSVIGIFKKPNNHQKQQYRLLQLSSLTTWLLGYYEIYEANNRNEIFGWICIFLLLSTLTLFWYSVHSIKGKTFALIFSKDKPSKINKDGVYVFIRHPFYFSYILCYFSVALYTGSMFNYGMAFVMYLIYWFAAHQEEQMFMDELGNQYVEYTNKAISIFPKFSPLKTLK